MFLRTRAVFKAALLSIPLLTGAIPASAQAPTGRKAFGHIYYPAREVVNAHEGSFEMIATLNFDPAKEHQVQYTAPMAFFLLRDFPEGDQPRLLIHFRSIATYQQQRKDGELLTSILGEGKAQTALALGGELIRKSLRVPAGKHQLKKGDTVHLAFTWRYDGNAYTSAVYINGALFGEQKGASIDPITFAGEPEVWIGAPHFHSAYGTIHGMRFSSVAREAEDFLKSAEKRSFEHDDRTLYIEDFQTIDSTAGDKQPLGKGGFIDGAYQLMKTDDGGRAVQLNAYDEESH